MNEEEIILRPEVRAFAEAMELKLRKNDFKGGWDDYDPIDLYPFLMKETEELYEHLDYQPDGGLGPAREAIDVGNYAMMIFDQSRKRMARNCGEGGCCPQDGDKDLPNPRNFVHDDEKRLKILTTLYEERVLPRVLKKLDIEDHKLILEDIE